MSNTEKEEMTFEHALEKLEKKVEQLEEENLSLDDSMKRYEEAMNLLNFCRKKLEQAEKKVSLLTENGEGFCLEEMEGEE